MQDGGGNQIVAIVQGCGRGRFKHFFSVLFYQPNLVSIFFKGGPTVTFLLSAVAPPFPSNPCKMVLSPYYTPNLLGSCFLSQFPALIAITGFCAQKQRNIYLFCGEKLVDTEICVLGSQIPRFFKSTLGFGTDPL